VALGPELPPFYTDDDALALDIARHAMAENDPLWRMPLWRPYQAMLDSKVADTNNVSSGNQGGSITAALFLSRFVKQAKSWVHLDVYGWVPSAKSARPEGGECQAARALYAMLRERYGSRRGCGGSSVRLGGPGLEREGQHHARAEAGAHHRHVDFRVFAQGLHDERAQLALDRPGDAGREAGPVVRHHHPIVVAVAHALKRDPAGVATR